jgi:hypothetical protein
VKQPKEMMNLALGSINVEKKREKGLNRKLVKD